MSPRAELSAEDMSILQNGRWEDCLARLKSMKGLSDEGRAAQFYDKAVAKHGGVLKRALMAETRSSFDSMGFPKAVTEMLIGLMDDGDYGVSKNVTELLRAVKNSREHLVNGIGNYDIISGGESISTGAADEIEILMQRGAVNSEEFRHLSNVALNLMQLSLLVTMTTTELIHAMLVNLATVMRGQFSDSVGAAGLGRAFEDAVKALPSTLDSLYALPLSALGVEIDLKKESK